MRIAVSSPEAMAAAAGALGAVVEGGDVIALSGELGAGKTAFVQGLARGLGVPPGVPVTSPTFTLINEYRGGRLPLFHVDLYRLDREEELAELGLDDIFRQDAIVAVEWFDKFPDAAPADVLEVRILVTGASERRLEVTPRGPQAAARAAGWRLS